MEDDETQLRELFLLSYDELMRFAYAMTRDPERAEDVVHDAFLRIWSRPRTLREPAAARAYLFRAVANLARTAGSRESRRVPIESTFRTNNVPDDLDLSLDLRAHLAALPTRRRACLVLRFVLDLTEAETAKAMGISIGTVKSQTHKALRSLEKAITADTREMS